MNPDQQHHLRPDKNPDSKSKNKEAASQLEKQDQAPDANAEQDRADKKEWKTKDQANQKKRLDEAELTPAESEEKEKAREEAKAALRQIYESLNQKQQQSKKSSQAPNQADVHNALEETILRELKPAYKTQVEYTIKNENLGQRSEEEFVERGMELLDLWIHLQGLHKGTDRDLADLRANIQTM